MKKIKKGYKAAIDTGLIRDKTQKMKPIWLSISVRRPICRDCLGLLVSVFFVLCSTLWSFCMLKLLRKVPDYLAEFLGVVLKRFRENYKFDPSQTSLLQQNDHLSLLPAAATAWIFLLAALWLTL